MACIRATEDKTEKHSVYVWGRNSCGELGESTPTDMDFIVDPFKTDLGDKLQISLVACGFAHVLMVTKQGQLYSMGSNEFGQLGLNDLTG